MPIARPLFRKGFDFTVVRRIRLTSTEFLEPGELIDKTKLKLHHIMSLYRRRRIGVKDHPWTEAMLANMGTFTKPEVTGVETVVETVVETQPTPAPVVPWQG